MMYDFPACAWLHSGIKTVAHTVACLRIASHAGVFRGARLSSQEGMKNEFP